MVKRKFWGWGREGTVLSAAEIAQFQSAYAQLFGVDGFAAVPTPRAEDIVLRAARLKPPGR